MTLAERLAGAPPWMRRALALAVLAFVAPLAYVLIVVPARWIGTSQDDWRVEVRRDLARARGRAAIEPRLRQQMDELSAAPIWHAFYQPQPGEDVLALIQQDVSRAGAAAGTTVQAVMPLPRAVQAGIVGYGIRFTVSVTAEQLKKFGDALRANPRYLRVERMSVNAPAVQVANDNARVDVSAEVYGYTRGEPRSSPGSKEGP